MRLNLNKNLFSFLVRGARLVLFSVVGLILFTVTAYAAKNTVFSDRKIDTLEEAAEKILKIELVKTPGERMAFEKGWKEIKEDPGFSTDLGKK
ncbi:MAG TPA: hypothetical protein VGA67_00175, partial [Candidatus Dojkabacteria bacterium]